MKSSTDKGRQSRQLIPGINDLASQFPQIAKEWHPELNGDLIPSEVFQFSSRKVWWLCRKCGHEWQAVIYNRTKNNTGCPVCSKAKVIPGINDLVSQRPELAQEWHPTLNGDLTPDQVTKGSNRKVWWHCRKCGYDWQASVNLRFSKSTGCPVCAERTIISGVNDLKTQRPDLAQEWHPTMNGELQPDRVAPNTRKKVWWHCSKCGHDWQAGVNARNSNGHGCPVCSGHAVMTGYNDLATLRPDLAQEWHLTLNGDLTPNQVTKGSKHKVWWHCRKCGYDWQAAVFNRTMGRQTGCPACAGRARKTKEQL